MRHHVDYCAHLVEDKSPNLATEKNIKQNRLQTVFSTFVQHTATPPPSMTEREVKRCLVLRQKRGCHFFAALLAYLNYHN